jgi:glycerate kinase
MNTPPLFKGTITHPSTTYVGVPIHDGAVGVYIAWLDAVSSATITLEVTSFGNDQAPVATAGTYQWKDSGVSVTGPAASAAGSSLVDVENCRQKRARLKIVTAATCSLEIYDGVNRL